MINENFVYFGALLSFIGSLSYLVDTVKGKTKPNRISWFLWALAPLVAFFAQLDEGVGIQAIMTFMVGFNPLCIFIASFLNKKAYWQLHKQDYLYGGLSVIGLILWLVTGDGKIAILFSIISDGLAAMPTVVKSWKNPETESSLIFLLSGISGLITILTIKEYNFAYLAFPVYISSICLLLFILIKFKIGIKMFGEKSSKKRGDGIS